MIPEQKINLKAHFSFFGPEWAAIKAWLEEERAIRVSKLIKAKTQEDSQEQRGAISVIDKLLFAEKDANIAQSMLSSNN